MTRFWCAYLHGRAEQQEELQPRRRLQVARVGVIDERSALDELHHQIRQAVRRAAAVEQARDVRVIQAGEDLPFGAEPPHDRLGVHSALEDLQGDALVEDVVVAHGQEDRAHAALAELAHEPVGAQARVHAWRAVGGVDAGDVVGCVAHGQGKPETEYNARSRSRGNRGSAVR
jgi:hypothetical protein